MKTATIDYSMFVPRDCAASCDQCGFVVRRFVPASDVQRGLDECRDEIRQHVLTTHDPYSIYPMTSKIILDPTTKRIYR